MMTLKMCPPSIGFAVRFLQAEEEVKRVASHAAEHEAEDSADQPARRQAPPDRQATVQRRERPQQAKVGDEHRQTP
jgi:hypothetical protein